MPRKKNEIKNYIFDKMGFITDYLQKQYELEKEFLMEFANAQLVRFYTHTADPYAKNLIICFMNNFAFTIYEYIDFDDDITFLPTRADKYFKLIGNSGSSVFMFWRHYTVEPTDRYIPPRCFEENDFAFQIYEESIDVTAVTMEKYINEVYLDRKTNTWKGLSAISAKYGFTPEEKIDQSYGEYVNYTDLIDDPDVSNFGGNTHSVNDLFRFWFMLKMRFTKQALLPDMTAYVQKVYEEQNVQNELEQQVLVAESNEAMLPQNNIIEPEVISNHNIPEFEIIDMRDQRILDYDVEGHIVGYSQVNGLFFAQKTNSQYVTDTTGNQRVSKTTRSVYTEPIYHENQILIFYDITITLVNGIIYITQIDLLQSLINPFPGQYVKLMITFENWIKTKMYLPIPDAQSPEWFKGAFPKTEYNHMTFYGGHSFYIPDGYTIDANMTRLTKQYGFLAIKFITDALNVKMYYLPMRNTVAYGKWTEYSIPDKSGLEAMLKDQYWSLDSKWRQNQYYIDSKEAAIALGQSGTKIAAAIPGLTTITGLINAGSGLI